MATAHAHSARPTIHLLAAESDMVATLALQAEDRQPVVAAMLLEEIERAELHEAETLPEDAITLGSEVDFVDERTHQLRTVELVLPAMANIAEGRISIMTPMGAALYGLTAGQSIDWPNLDGAERRIRILRVRQPLLDEPPSAA
ncbi:MAG TPA: nucleoside diphosphate kinase regulator [Sphingomicrobium sp.]|nr:nucleoside diphosphate kinase regulator [Sphingomicrobium sp.]